MKKMHLGLLAAGGFIVLLILLRPHSDKPTTTPPAALTVTTTTLTRQPLQRSLEATGSINAWQELIIAPQVGGYRVEAVNVDIGSAVKAGQELARLDSGLLQTEVQARRAGLTKAKALQDRAESAYRRGETLAQQKLLSQSDLERLQSDKVAAQGDTELARANLNSAELNLQHARITAPAAGVITARSVNLGEIAQMGKVMFNLLRDSRIEWRAEVPEAQLRQLHAGQPVQIHTADGKTLNGKLRSIDPTVNASKRSALVYVDLPVADGARPGMYARGEFVLDKVEANTLPLSSVIRNDGYSYVFTVGKGNIVQRHRVETGALVGDRIEVIGGLVAAQRVVHSGAAFLKEGDRVDVVPGEVAPGEVVPRQVAPVEVAPGKVAPGKVAPAAPAPAAVVKAP